MPLRLTHPHAILNKKGKKLGVFSLSRSNSRGRLFVLYAFSHARKGNNEFFVHGRGKQTDAFPLLDNGARYFAVPRAVCKARLVSGNAA